MRHALRRRYGHSRVDRTIWQLQHGMVLGRNERAPRPIADLIVRGLAERVGYGSEKSRIQLTTRGERALRGIEIAAGRLAASRRDG